MALSPRFPLLTVSLLFCPAAAAPQYSPSAFSADYEIAGGSESVTIPFELANNHLLVRVRVNGQGPFQLIVDTGMPIPGVLLWKSSATRALGLEYSSEMMIRGAGRGEQDTTRAPVAQGVTVGIGGLTLPGQQVIVSPLTSKLGQIRYHHGAIGATLFWNFQVEIDYERQLLHLHERGTLEPADGSGMLPLEIRGYPFATIGVSTGNNGLVEASVVVDLGASHVLSLRPSTLAGVSVPEPSLPTVVGRGMSGTVHGRLARVDAITLAGFRLADALVGFPSDESGIGSAALGQSGNLGSGALRRFHIVFDYPQSRMWLKPNSDFATPFEYSMSGLILLDHDDGFRIDELVGHSPAVEAGLRPDDIIVEIDGRQAGSYTHTDLRRLMRREGATVSLSVRRGSETLSVLLKLRRLI